MFRKSCISSYGKYTIIYNLRRVLAPSQGWLGMGFPKRFRPSRCRVPDLNLGALIASWLMEIRRGKPIVLDVYKTTVNKGINYQPQLVSRISEPSTVVCNMWYFTWPVVIEWWFLIYRDIVMVISKDQTAVIQSCGNNLVKNASWCCWIQWNRIPINIVSKCIQTNKYSQNSSTKRRIKHGEIDFFAGKQFPVFFPKKLKATSLANPEDVPSALPPGKVRVAQVPPFFAYEKVGFLDEIHWKYSWVSAVEADVEAKFVIFILYS